jgi:hypothetical protein
VTEHNHRRGTRARGSNVFTLPRGHCRFAQRYAHHRRRTLVRKLITVGRVDDLPGNEPKYIRWEYW